MVSECGRVPLFGLLAFGCGARVALGHQRRRRKEFQNRRLLAVVCFVYMILGRFILSDASILRNVFFTLWSSQETRIHKRGRLRSQTS